MPLPSSYSMGEEYFKNSTKIKVALQYFFNTYAIVNSFEFETEDGIVKTYQTNNGFYVVEIQRKIPEKLFDDIEDYNEKVRKYLCGYLDKVLPKVNEGLWKQRYLEGHVLITICSMMQLRAISVTEQIDTNNSLTKSISIDWSITPFPPAVKLASKQDVIYLRDLLDAMTLYFSNDFDECVRKLITSLENFFHYCCYTGNFKKKLEQALEMKNHPKQWHQYIKIWKKNIHFLYEVRNGIVHNDFRMNFSDELICRRGIGTVQYIFNSFVQSEERRRYVFSLTQQFVALRIELSGMHLDYLENRYGKEPVEGVNIAKAGESEAEFIDRIMFTGLEIEDKDIERITALIH